MKRLSISLRYAVIALMLFYCLEIHAQADPPPPPDGGGGPGSVNDVPIDVVLDYILVLSGFIGVWFVKAIDKQPSNYGRKY